MSKIFRTFLPVFAAFVLILHLFNHANAQDIELMLKIDVSHPQIVTVEGKRTGGQSFSRNLSFVTSVAGVTLSDKRISDLKIFDSTGAAVPYKKFNPSEYLADREFTVWSYQVDLSPPEDQTLKVRISWMEKNVGILMFDDLLPQFSRSLNIRKISEDFPWPDRNSIIPADDRKGTYLIGGDWKCNGSMLWSRNTGFTLSTCYLGYSDSGHKTGILAADIYGDYEKRFGDQPSHTEIAIMKFRDGATRDVWEAETRGRTITILTSDTSFESHALQQLHEQLRHEIFHLWIPNGVNLTGNYDWFYEGFALYQSLKTGVALNRIRFDDYLDTLSRAFDVDRRLAQKLSLIDISKNRWAGDNNTRIYARGMLVAFLCDLALLEKSKGKRSVTDLLRKLYERHRPPSAEMDGNAAVLNLLGSYEELKPIIARNITGSESIDWDKLINTAGLEIDRSAPSTSLKVMAKPSGRQKDLLDRLGYNNWRKLLTK